MADPRDGPFGRARNASIREIAALETEALGDVRSLLAEARTQIAARLGSASEFERWRLPRVQAGIDRVLDELTGELTAGAGRVLERAWGAGLRMVDEPLAAGGVRIGALFDAPDARQLLAMRTFTTDRMRDVGSVLRQRIDGQLGLALTGVQTPSQTMSAIEQLVEGGRGRAQTITRTELGRAFGTAGQERKLQAAEVLPGLRKQWRRSGKIRPRFTHELADGQIRRPEEPYLIGGIEIMYPRDPEAPASQTINCGCLSLPYMERWEVSQPGRQPFTPEELSGSSPAARTRRTIAEVAAGEPQPSGAGLIGQLTQGSGTSDPVAARQAISAGLREGRLEAFVADPASLPGGQLPIALLQPNLAEALGARNGVVRLSTYTVEKQGRRHPDLGPGDYRRVQRLLDQGEVIEEHHGLAFHLLDQGRWWRSVVKVTAAGDELYLSTLHRTQPRRRDKARLRGRVLRETEGG